MSIVTDSAPETADKSIVILESLLCLLRERNILSRADIEELCAKVKDRADHQGVGALPCCDKEASEAATIVSSLSSYIGQRYGGKHRRA